MWIQQVCHSSRVRWWALGPNRDLAGKSAFAFLRAFWPWGCHHAEPGFTFLVQRIPTFSVILSIVWNRAECLPSGGAQNRWTPWVECPLPWTLPQIHWATELKPFLQSLGEFVLDFKKYSKTRTCISSPKKKKINPNSGIQIHKCSCHALNCSFYLQMRVWIA